MVAPLRKASQRMHCAPLATTVCDVRRKRGRAPIVRTLLRMLRLVGTSRFDEDRDPFLEPSPSYGGSSSIFD